ncbi:hypothetical protein WN943_023554 [Citrus x changshan-huyou]
MVSGFAAVEDLGSLARIKKKKASRYGYCDSVSRAREIFDELSKSGKDMKISTPECDAWGLLHQRFANGNRFGDLQFFSGYFTICKCQN